MKLLQYLCYVDKLKLKARSLPCNTIARYNNVPRLPQTKHPLAQPIRQRSIHKPTISS